VIVITLDNTIRQQTNSWSVKSPTCQLADIAVLFWQHHVRVFA